MIEIREIEIEFLKVFLLGVFLGWNFCKYLRPVRSKGWMTIKNIRFDFMNEKHKN